MWYQTGSRAEQRLSCSSQEKLNLSQLPFLLSSPSNKYACVEILNCPSVVLALVSVPPPPLTPCCPPCHPPLARRPRQASDGQRTFRYPMSVSRLAFPSPKSNPGASHVPPPPSLKSVVYWRWDNARLNFKEEPVVSLRLAALATSCFLQRVWSGERWCDLLFLFFCVCLPRCAVSKHEGSGWPVQAQQHQLWSWRGARYVQSAAYLAETRRKVPRSTNSEHSLHSHTELA